jgi:hypothetical protein
MALAWSARKATHNTTVVRAIDSMLLRHVESVWGREAGLGEYVHVDMSLSK